MRFPSHSALRGRAGPSGAQLFAFLLLCLPITAAWAIGLGPIKVNSQLHQPLRAEISVVQADPRELVGLEAGLADIEDQRRLGLERISSHPGLQFSVVRNGRGAAVIRVESPDAINEPTLTFLVSARWATGRVLREYSVTLDPGDGSVPPEAASEALPVAATPPNRVEPTRPAPATAPSSPPPAVVAPSAPAPATPTAKNAAPNNPPPSATETRAVAAAATADSNAAKSKAELDRVNALLAAKEKEARELRERVAALESSTPEKRKLIGQKDAQIDQIQSEIAALAAKAKRSQASAPPAQTSTPTSAAATTAAGSTETTAPAPVVAASNAAAADPAPAPAPAIAAAAPPTTATPAEPAESPGAGGDSIWGKWWLLLTGLLVVGAGVVLALRARSKKAPALEWVDLRETAAASPSEAILGEAPLPAKVVERDLPTRPVSSTAKTSPGTPAPSTPAPNRPSAAPAPPPQAEAARPAAPSPPREPKHAHLAPPELLEPLVRSAPERAIAVAPAPSPAASAPPASSFDTTVEFAAPGPTSASSPAPVTIIEAAPAPIAPAPAVAPIVPRVEQKYEPTPAEEDFPDLDDGDSATLTTPIDGVATKLQLAHAYVEMDDDEGAIEILKEVVAEGTLGQQQDARKLLAQLTRPKH